MNFLALDDSRQLFADELLNLLGDEERLLFAEMTRMYGFIILSLDREPDFLRWDFLLSVSIECLRTEHFGLFLDHNSVVAARSYNLKGKVA